MKRVFDGRWAGVQCTLSDWVNVHANSHTHTCTLVHSPLFSQYLSAHSIHTRVHIMTHYTKELLFTLTPSLTHREDRYVALKIVKSARHYTETAIDEIELLKKVATTKPTAPGWNHVVQMYDSFKINGPHGTRILVQRCV